MMLRASEMRDASSKGSELSGDRNSAVMIEITLIPSSAQTRDVGG